MHCQHRGCKCSDAAVERGGKMFCSQKCADIEISGRHQSHCPCGHPDCAA